MACAAIAPKATAKNPKTAAIATQPEELSLRSVMPLPKSRKIKENMYSPHIMQPLAPRSMPQAIHMTFKWLSALLPLLVSACIGINPNSSPKDTFTVPVPYEVVFERAKAQAQRCWSADGEFPVIGSINATDRTAFVAVTGELGGSRYGQVNIRALDHQSSQVQTMVNGINIWNTQSLAAMHEVIQFGSPTCISYMPKPQP